MTIQSHQFLYFFQINLQTTLPKAVAVIKLIDGEKVAFEVEVSEGLLDFDFQHISSLTDLLAETWFISLFLRPAEDLKMRLRCKKIEKSS